MSNLKQKKLIYDFKIGIKIKFRVSFICLYFQATEPEVLVPIVRGVRQLVLVGDHCQLGPVIMCKKVIFKNVQQRYYSKLRYVFRQPKRVCSSRCSKDSFCSAIAPSVCRFSTECTQNSVPFPPTFSMRAVFRMESLTVRRFFS